MIRSKRYYADRVKGKLIDSYPNIDWKIDERDIFVVLDDIVNALAKQNYLENWKLGAQMVDEHFITTWDGDTAITVVDTEGQPSYIELPAHYAALPMNGGIEEVWPQSYEYGAVKKMQHRDVRGTRNLMSGNMQGELGGYPMGTRFVFNQTDVGTNFCQTFGVRLVIKDSTQIAVTAPYPIPANLEEEVVQRAFMYFVEKRMQPTDTVRDRNDAVNKT